MKREVGGTRRRKVEKVALLRDPCQPKGACRAQRPDRPPYSFVECDHLDRWPLPIRVLLMTPCAVPMQRECPASRRHSSVAGRVCGIFRDETPRWDLCHVDR